MSGTSKVLSLTDLGRTVEKRRAEGKTIVHCHGVFDLLHVGHIRHLAQAKSLGDVLVVTVTPDRFVNKGPARPAFPDVLRAEAVAALDQVDFVAVTDSPTAVPVLELLRPSIYIKGAEYADEKSDLSGGIAKERAAVEAGGGRLEFTGGITFSSSKLINQFLPVLSDEAKAFLEAFKVQGKAGDVVPALEAVADLKVLVVGETIIDEYQYCDSIGKSSKSAALVAKRDSEERFGGGILAVANHVAALCGSVTVLSQLGNENREEDFVRGQLREEVEGVFLTRHDSPTIVKRRFVESYFLTSMFEVYEINDGPITPEDDQAVCEALESRIEDFDLVIVVDYGHGMLSRRAIDILCRKARFLAMNAQANAGNRGYHRISKYPRADYVCAAKNEMYLEAHDWRGELRPIVEDVAGRMSCPRVVATCGDQGALCYSAESGFVEVPAFATRVVDRVGAGDAFLSVTAPLVSLGIPMDLVGFVGNVAGAEAVATVGHRRYCDFSRLAKQIQVLLA